MFPAVPPRHAAVVDALFSGLLDDAAMYPPAAAPLEAALALHAAATASAWRAAVGQFLCPAGAIGQLATERRLLGMTDPLPVGVVIGSPADPLGGGSGPGGHLEATLRRVVEEDDGVTITGIEVRPSSPSAVAAAVEVARALAEGAGAAQVAIEVAIRDVATDTIAEQVATVTSARRDDERVIGKVRCGSVDPSAVPTVDELALFLTACGHAQLPFKATAGLHQAAAGSHDGTRHHGYLNLLAAADAAREHSASEVAQVLASTEVSVTPTGLEAGGHGVPLAELVQVRSTGVRSFGTCSFTEPVAALLELIGGDDE